MGGARGEVRGDLSKLLQVWLTPRTRLRQSESRDWWFLCVCV